MPLRVLTAFDRDRAVDCRTAGCVSTGGQRARLHQPWHRLQRCGQGPQRADSRGGSRLRDLENARLDALQLALWDAAIDGDVCAAVAVVKIVHARVHLNGLEPPRDGLEATPHAPQTLVVPPGS